MLAIFEIDLHPCCKSRWYRLKMLVFAVISKNADFVNPLIKHGTVGIGDSHKSISIFTTSITFYDISCIIFVVHSSLNRFCFFVYNLSLNDYTFCSDHRIWISLLLHPDSWCSSITLARVNNSARRPPAIVVRTSVRTLVWSPCDPRRPNPDGHICLCIVQKWLWPPFSETAPRLCL